MAKKKQPLNDTLQRGQVSGGFPTNYATQDYSPAQLAVMAGDPLPFSPNNQAVVRGDIATVNRDGFQQLPYRPYAEAPLPPQAIPGAAPAQTQLPDVASMQEVIRRTTPSPQAADMISERTGRTLTPDEAASKAMDMQVQDRFRNDPTAGTMSPRASTAQRQADGRQGKPAKQVAEMAPFVRSGDPKYDAVYGAAAQVGPQMQARAQEIRSGFAGDRANVRAVMDQPTLPTTTPHGLAGGAPLQTIETARQQMAAAMQANDPVAYRAAEQAMRNAQLDAGGVRTYGRLTDPNRLPKGTVTAQEAAMAVPTDMAGSRTSGVEQDKLRNLRMAMDATSAGKAAADQRFTQQAAAGPQSQADSYAQINARRAEAGLPPLAVPTAERTQKLKDQAATNSEARAVAEASQGRANAAQNDAARANVVQNSRAGALARRDRLGMEPVMASAVVNSGLTNGAPLAKDPQAQPQQPGGGILDGVRQVMGSIFGGGNAQPQSAPAPTQNNSLASGLVSGAINSQIYGPVGAAALAEQQGRNQSAQQIAETNAGAQRYQSDAYRQAQESQNQGAAQRHAETMQTQRDANSQEAAYRNSQLAAQDREAQMNAIAQQQQSLTAQMQAFPPGSPERIALATQIDSLSAQSRELATKPLATQQQGTVGGITNPGAQPQPAQAAPTAPAQGPMAAAMAREAALNAPVDPTYGHYMAANGGFTGLEQYVHPVTVPSQYQIDMRDPAAANYNRGVEEAKRWTQRVEEAAATDPLLQGPSGFFGHGQVGTDWANRAFHALRARTGAPEPAILMYLARKAGHPEWVTPQWRNVIVGSGVGQRGDFNGGAMGGGLDMVR